MGSSGIRFLVAGVATLALAACGVVPSGDDDPPATTPAATATESERRVVSGRELARELSAAALKSGTVHLRTESAQSDSGEGRMVAEGDLRYTAPVAQTLELRSDDGVLRSVLVDGVGYLRGVPTRVRGKPWLRLDAATYKRLGASTAALNAPPDDVTGLGAFARSLTFTDTGSSALPGTRQYTAHLTTDEWLASLRAASRDDMRAWTKREGVTGGTITVFVDGRGLPVKQIFTLQPNSAQFTIQSEFSRWGEPVSITAPPRRQVVSCADTPACRPLRTT